MAHFSTQIRIDATTEEVWESIMTTQQPIRACQRIQKVNNDK